MKKINGKINAPASKSMVQRAFAASLLCKGKSSLHNYSPCDDSEVALKIIKQLGADYTIINNKIEIVGGLNPRENILNSGESGLSIRMFTPIASLSKSKIILTGTGSLINRPVAMLNESLTKLGVKCESNNGFLPISVQGGLKGGEVEIDGSITSQVLTGLLFALPLVGENSVIRVNDLKSKPYIDMTIELLQNFGITIEHKDYKIFYIKGNQKYQPTNYFIEGDWSGAAFLLVAGAIGGHVEVTNLNIISKQADMNILEAIIRIGAAASFSTQSIKVWKNNLRAFDFDSTHCPDLFPPLVALSAHCKGVTKIKGVKRLKYKESNRALVLKKEFEKIGVRIEISDDIMKIYGGKVKGGKINSNNDHRIAMAGAIAGILSENKVIIENSECVNKSYPSFFADLQKITQV